MSEINPNEQEQCWGSGIDEIAPGQWALVAPSFLFAAILPKLKNKPRACWKCARKKRGNLQFRSAFNAMSSRVVPGKLFRGLWLP